MFPTEKRLPAFVTGVIATGALAGLLAATFGGGSGDTPLLLSLVLAGEQVQCPAGAARRRV